MVPIFCALWFPKIVHSYLPNIVHCYFPITGSVANGGLWRYDGSTFTNFTQNFVGYVYEDKNGNIWTSSANASYERNWVLSRYEAKSLSNKKPTVTEIKPEVGGLFGILEDDEGNIWFGGMGVYRYDGNTITDFKGKDGQE